MDRHSSKMCTWQLISHSLEVELQPAFLLSKLDCVHTDQSLQLSSVLSYYFLCVVTGDLGIWSSADRWAQLETRMDGCACMYAQVNTSCPCTPDCGMFAFDTKGFILQNVWPLVVMSTCMVRRSDTLRMFKHPLSLIFQVYAPLMYSTHVCLHWVLPSATGGVFALSLLGAAEGETCGCTKVHTYIDATSCRLVLS